MRPNTSVPSPVTLWVLLCLLCNCAGWALSAVGQLNSLGYALVFALGLPLGYIAACRLGARVLAPAPDCNRNRLRDAKPCRRSWGRRLTRWLHRFRRPFPLAFFVVAGLAAIGGALYAPTNYDALAYRLPRVLNWLADGHWHWIHTEFNRLNTRAFGYEWLATPLIAFTRSDRLLFLINIASLLLLPGLVFSVFSRLGVRPRVAWHWMWLVPTGYCYLLQAGGIGNDLFGAVFALAAVDFALRARKSKQIGDAWLSVLAAALLTGSKASNLPLLLPWVVAIAPSARLLSRRLIPSFLVGALALPASLAPLVAINLKYSGDWTGIAAENVQSMERTSFVHLANNAVLLPLQNLAPPVFPLAGQWNRAVERAMPSALRAKLEQAFEPGGAHWMLGEMQIEEAAGLGFGVTALLLGSLVVALCQRRTPAAGPAQVASHLGRNLSPAGASARSLSPRTFPADRLPLLVLGCVFIALLAFMAKSGLTAAARLTTPYYPLLLPAALLSARQLDLVRARWWRVGAMCVFLLAGLLLVLSPARPLWPANALLSKADGSRSKLLERAKAVYSVFGQRADSFAPVRERLPRDLKVLGLVASDDPETSLWRPFGHRRVVHVTHSDSAADLRARQIEYVLVNSKKLEKFFQRSFADWAAAMDAEVLAQITLPLRVTDGPSDWFLVKLRRNG